MPRRLAASVDRSSGVAPTCQPPVPALSISISPSRPRSATSARNTPSAVGERQMLPRQTKRTRVIAGVALGLRPALDEEVQRQLGVRCRVVLRQVRDALLGKDLVIDVGVAGARARVTGDDR